MNSTNNNGNESPPPEDEDRGLLFGPRKEGPEPAGDRQKPRRSGASASSPPSRTSPPAEAPDPAGHGETAASSDAVQRRILAGLEDLEKKLAVPAAREADLTAAARTITEQADRIAEATKWVNDTKAAISEILASTGKQIEGLKSAQKTHDEALARLKVQEKGLDKVEKSLGATAKGLEERSSELGAVKQDLATYYRSWTARAKTSLAEMKTSRAEMKTLTERLNAGDHMVTRLEGLQKGWTDQMEKSIGANSAAQRDAAEKTAGNVEQLAATVTEFLKEFAKARAAALKEARQEWTWIRRWTLPALAIALVLAAPPFMVAGGVVQSEFGVLAPYDETGGFKEAVWQRYGGKIEACLREAKRTGQVIECSFDVMYP